MKPTKTLKNVVVDDPTVVLTPALQETRTNIRYSSRDIDFFLGDYFFWRAL